MVLSERQQLAKRLADELDAMDSVWVTSPLPLDDNAKLRLQVKDVARNEVTQLLKDWGYEPVFVSILPRVCVTGLIAASLWEIDLPKPRQNILDDRHGGEIATKKKPDHEDEVAKMIQHIYGRQR
jgi:hypothetical protein